MKNILILIPVLAIFYGCSKEDNSVIVPETAGYQVLFVSSILNFEYFPGDSTRNISITFNSLENISSVSYNITTPEGKNLYPSAVNMVRGNNEYSARLSMSKHYLSGSYTVKYFVTDISGSIKIAAFYKFNYNNGSTNLPPVISNAIVNPDSFVIDTTTALLLVTLEVHDPDGLNDIELVYFISIRPDGTSSGNQNLLFDDGIKDSDYYDEIAGDGIFSRAFSLPPSTTKGTWIFEFRARDRAKQLSNIIQHKVVIQ
jgi:hypothetical protein